MKVIITTGQLLQKTFGVAVTEESPLAVLSKKYPLAESKF